MAKKKNRFYAYIVGSREGIVSSWPECEKIVKGKAARYKGFPSKEEAMAWLAGGGLYESRSRRKKQLRADLPEDAVYFDAGTGRGRGTEVMVSDREGTPLTFLALDESRVTAEGTLLLPGRTNNYGELMGCLLALRVALKRGLKMVMGDSRLVIDFWSLGRIRKQAAQDKDLRALVAEVAELRRSFEAAGGVVKHISGDINPADLGFHR